MPDGRFPVSAATATRRGIIDTLAQTFSGLKAFDDGIMLPDGAAASKKIIQIGNASEALEIRIMDETLTGLAAVSTDLTENLPADSLVIGTQLRILTTCVAGGDTIKVGCGPASDPDKYAITSDLIKDTGDEKFALWSSNPAAVDLQIHAVENFGALGSGAFTAGAVRVRMVYLVLLPLDLGP